MIIGIDAHQLEGVRTGVGRYLYNILKQWQKETSRLLKEGIFFVLYFESAVPGDCRMLQKPLFATRILPAPFGMKSKFLYYNVSIPRAARRDRVDMMFFPFYMLPVTYIGKAVVTVHDISYKVHPKWFAKGYGIPLRALTYFALKRANHIITVSEFSKNQILTYYPFLRAGNITTTLLGVDELFFQRFPESKARAILQEYDCRPQKYFFYVGSIFNRRHVKELIEAFEQIAREYSDMNLLLIGRDITHPAQHIQAMIEKTNAILGRQAIIHRNSIPDEHLAILYQQAKAFLLLSEYEGFGLPPLEAMASGVPVVSTNKTSLKETVDHAGIVIKNPSSIKEISWNLRLLMTNKQLSARLIKKGYMHIKRFSWERTASQTLAILTSIL